MALGQSLINPLSASHRRHKALRHLQPGPLVHPGLLLKSPHILPIRRIIEAHVPLPTIKHLTTGFPLIQMGHTIVGPARLGWCNTASSGTDTHWSFNSTT